MSKFVPSSPSPTPPEQRAGFLVYRAGLAVSRGYERALEPIELSPAQVGVMSVLAYSGPNHVRGLARMLGLGRQSVVNTTKQLEESKFIVRTQSDSDARLTMLSMTTLGKKKLQQAERIVSAFDASLSEVIGKENESKLIAILFNIVRAPFLEHEQ